MTELARFQSLWSDMDELLVSYRKEATELRDAPGEVTRTEDLPALYDRIVATRRAQDRLEAIVANLGLIKSRCSILVSELKETYEQAWTAVMQRTQTGEYMSAKEKDATYSAGSIQERINLRRAERMLADSTEVYEFCLFKFRGLDSSRRDTESRIRLLNVESMLER